jgi:hypothetical protein
MQDLANKRPAGECLTAHSFVTGLDYHDTKTTLRSGAGETGVFTMKRSSFTLAALMVLALAVAPAFAQQSQTTPVRVKGYVKRDGTYVAPSRRTAPDARFNNNWSTKGNYNPYTGAAGTKTTRPSRRHN